MFEIQGKGKHGDWDSEYVSSDPSATQFETEAEAKAAIEEIRAIGTDWANREYRIIETA